MITIKFLTHSMLPEHLDYVMRKGAIIPWKRYRYMRYRIFGLSINGSYAYFADGYIAHIVFPARIVRTYSVKPVIYVNYDIAKTMIPSKDRRTYYYHRKLAFEMELVSESEIPLHEAEAVYVSRYVIHNDIIVKLERFCREHGIPVHYGIPADQETKEIATKMLRGDSKTIDEYNKTVCRYFGVDCRIPREEELIELFNYWSSW